MYLTFDIIRLFWWSALRPRVRFEGRVSWSAGVWPHITRLETTFEEKIIAQIDYEMQSNIW